MGQTIYQSKVKEVSNGVKQELEEMLKETGSSFSLEYIKDVIYNEEDNDDMQKIIAMFDDGDPTNVSNVIELMTDAWNYFPHKILGGLSPTEKLLEN